MPIKKSDDADKCRWGMKIEEAAVYLLSASGCEISTDTLAREINLRELHLRKDGNQ